MPFDQEVVAQKDVCGASKVAAARELHRIARCRTAPRLELAWPSTPECAGGKDSDVHAAAHVTRGPIPDGLHARRAHSPTKRLRFYITRARGEDRLSFRVPPDLPDGTCALTVIVPNNLGLPGFGDEIGSNPAQFIRVVAPSTTTFQIASERLDCERETAAPVFRKAGSDEIGITSIAVPIGLDLTPGPLFERTFAGLQRLRFGGLQRVPGGVTRRPRLGTPSGYVSSHDERVGVDDALPRGRRSVSPGTSGRVAERLAGAWDEWRPRSCAVAAAPRRAQNS